MAAQLDRPPLSRLRARYERQIRFLVRRFDPGAALGLSLTASLAAVVVVGWAFGIVVQDVIVGDGSIGFDRPVLGWLARHREPWLTVVMKTVTELGSSLVLVPLIGLAFILLVGRRRRTPAGVVDAPAPGSPDAPLFATPARLGVESFLVPFDALPANENRAVILSH